MATKGDVAEVVLDKKSKKKSVKKIKPGKTYKIVLPEGSPLGEGLLRMLEHKKLRENFGYTKLLLKNLIDNYEKKA